MDIKSPGMIMYIKYIDDVNQFEFLLVQGKLGKGGARGQDGIKVLFR